MWRGFPATWNSPLVRAGHWAAFVAGGATSAGRGARGTRDERGCVWGALRSWAARLCRAWSLLRSPPLRGRCCGARLCPFLAPCACVTASAPHVLHPTPVSPRFSGQRPRPEKAPPSTLLPSSLLPSSLLLSRYLLTTFASPPPFLHPTFHYPRFIAQRSFTQRSFTQRSSPPCNASPFSLPTAKVSRPVFACPWVYHARSTTQGPADQPSSGSLFAVHVSAVHVSAVHVWAVHVPVAKVSATHVFAARSPVACVSRSPARSFRLRFRCCASLCIRYCMEYRKGVYDARKGW